MSKIQINELSTASIEELNVQETAEVVGGFFDFKQILQGNANSTVQAAVSGGFVSPATNINGTGQGNTAFIF